MDGVAQLVFVGPALGDDGHAVDGLREVDGRKGDRGPLHGKAVPHLGAVELGNGEDVAHGYLLDVLAILAGHELEGADPFLFALVHVENGVVGREAPGIDPDEGELAHVGVNHDLEADGGELSCRIGGDLDAFLSLQGGAFPGFDGGREEIGDEVEDLVHAHVQGGRTGEDGQNGAGNDGLPESGKKLLHGDGLAVEVAHHEFVVRLNDGLHEGFPCLGGFVSQLCGNVALGELAAAVGFIHIGLVPEEIHHSLEGGLGAHGQENRHGLVAVVGPDIVEDLAEIGVFTVELGDVEGCRNFELASGLPGLVRLDFNAADTAHGDEQRIGNPDGGPHFPDKVRESGGVEDEELSALALHGDKGSIDRDLPFLFLLAEIADGVAVFDLSQSGRDAVIEKHGLDEGRLSCPSMGRNCDTACVLRLTGSHSNYLLRRLVLCPGLFFPSIEGNFNILRITFPFVNKWSRK